MVPESGMQAATLLREVKPRLADDRQRGVAEEMARRFEERAAERSGDACRARRDPARPRLRLIDVNELA